MKITYLIIIYNNIYIFKKYFDSLEIKISKRKNTFSTNIK